MTAASPVRSTGGGHLARRAVNSVHGPTRDLPQLHGQLNRLGGSYAAEVDDERAVQRGRRRAAIRLSPQPDADRVAATVAATPYKL